MASTADQTQSPPSFPADAADSAKLMAQFEKDVKKCERWKSKLLKHSPMVKFMMGNLERVGCKFEPKHLICTPCPEGRSGGFSPALGIVLCQDKFVHRQHMEDTLTHELIHAFDHCTTKVNWNNCEQHACAEIRAANLSGECKFTRELQRGHFSIAKHHQTCVRRRAILSLKQNPKCAGPNVAEDAVRFVWDACFKDTAPFDEIA